jgi:hypothetical protein
MHALIQLMRALNQLLGKLIKIMHALINLMLHVALNQSLCTLIKMINRVLIQLKIIYGFMSRSRIFHLYGDLTIAGEGLQNLGLCSALRAFEQGGIFIVPRLLRHGASVFPVSSEGPINVRINSFDACI